MTGEGLSGHEQSPAKELHGAIVAALNDPTRREFVGDVHQTRAGNFTATDHFSSVYAGFDTSSDATYQESRKQLLEEGIAGVTVTVPAPPGGTYSYLASYTLAYRSQIDPSRAFSYGIDVHDLPPAPSPQPDGTPDPSEEPFIMRIAPGEGISLITDGPASDPTLADIYTAFLGRAPE